MQGLPQSSPQGPPLITAAPVMGIMLGLLTGCDDADERLATLTTLKRLIGQPHTLAHGLFFDTVSLMINDAGLGGDEGLSLSPSLCC